MSPSIGFVLLLSEAAMSMPIKENRFVIRFYDIKIIGFLCFVLKKEMHSF